MSSAIAGSRRSASPRLVPFKQSIYGCVGLDGRRQIGGPMKRIIVAIVALLACVSRVMAADMPVPQGAPVPPPTYFPAYFNWSGIYLGVNGGSGFGPNPSSVVRRSTANFHTH